MAKKGSVLVVDDEEIMRDVLETLLSAEGYRVDLAKTGEEGLECYGRRAYDVVLMDVSMPGMGGLRALEEILRVDPEAVVVIITAYATFDTAIGAWERGAAGCIRKPFQNEQIVSTVAAGIRRRRKEEERQSLRRAMSRSVERGSIIGRSEKMQAIFSLVDQVAPARSTVLITGESGTGKELIARAIHMQSTRAAKSFVTVNSSNTPSELLESELSDHLAPDVLALLEQYTWPGNVRELENVIERAVVIAPGPEVTRQCLPAEIADPSKAMSAAPLSNAAGALDVSHGVNFYDEVRRFEIDLIRRALDRTGGHQSRAARLLGMNATTLNSKIKTYNIQLRS